MADEDDDNADARSMMVTPAMCDVIFHLCTTALDLSGEFTLFMQNAHPDQDVTMDDIEMVLESVISSVKTVVGVRIN